MRSEQRQHVLGIGIAAEHRLREDELTVDVHVEDATAPRHELDDAQLGGKLFENLCRQTDGIRQGASGNAVFDANGSAGGHDASYPAGVVRQSAAHAPTCLPEPDPHLDERIQNDVPHEQEGSEDHEHGNHSRVVKWVLELVADDVRG